MINIFDLSTGMAGNKNRDGSPVRRSRSDVIKTPTDPIGIYRDDITYSLQITNIVKKNSSSKKGGTPMKMLIAQEMLKETESKRKQPSIVARLMGLDDALPVQQPVLCAKRNLQEEYPRSKSAGALRSRRQQEDVYFDSPRSREIHSCSHEKEYKDVYEVWQQSKATNHTRDHAPLKERVNQSQKERKMALVRQTFMEAKRLATDEKHLESKEFQDALEVLSSNKDLFLKFLEEPNSLFLKHIKELHTITSPTKTKRIAVLKPSTFEPKDDKQVKQKQCPPLRGKEWGIEKSQRGSDYSRRKAEMSPSTRIVVLKPSPTKICDLKGTKTTTPISSPEFLRQVSRCQDFEAGQAVGSREMAKEITRQMRESVTSNCRDESLLSSALSNGYVGDNSSFDRSDNEYIDLGNLSDTEIMTPTSRNSWDSNNRIGSPYSVCSFSRAPCSPESSMVREAKKRLSERWASVTSTNISQEQIQVQKSSSTLGEMLAIAEVKKEEVINVVFDVSINRSSGEEELRSSPARLSTGSRKVVDGGESSRILPRSKSVPVTCSAYENIGLNKETPDSQNGRSKAPNEAAKSKSAKSSFKGKVSSFFWRNKKPNKQKNVPSPLVGADDRFNSESPESISKNREDLPKSVHNNSDDLSKPVHHNSDDISESVHISSSHETLPVSSEDRSSRTSYPGSGSDGLRKGVLSSKVDLSLEKPKTLENLIKDQSSLGPSENSSGNQDQPSPVSVLDAPFEDNAHSNISPSEIVNVSHPQALSRSEPIQSVVRTLSWDDLQLETTSSHEEQELFVLVQDLLSSAGIDLERVNTVFNSWHSLESPLNPILLFNMLDQKEEGAKGRERRSRQRLLFDCVNGSILDIGHIALRNGFSWDRPCKSQRGDPASTLVAAEVWGLVRARFASEVNQVSRETDNNSMVDGLLRKDLAGKKWTELMLMEIDGVCQDIVGNISDELIAEALLDITDE